MEMFGRFIHLSLSHPSLITSRVLDAYVRDWRWENTFGLDELRNIHSTNCDVHHNTGLMICYDNFMFTVLYLPLLNINVMFIDFLHVLEVFGVF